MGNVLATIAIAGLLGVAPAGATADRQADIEAAKLVAAQWLNLMDSRKYEEAYDEMAAVSRKSISREEWVQIMSGLHNRLGALQQRVVVMIRPVPAFPRAPPGEYVLYQTRILTGNFPDERTHELYEVLVLFREALIWKVYGYVVTRGAGTPLHPG